MSRNAMNMLGAIAGLLGADLPDGIADVIKKSQTEYELYCQRFPTSGDSAAMGWRLLEQVCAYVESIGPQFKDKTTPTQRTDEMTSLVRRFASENELTLQDICMCLKSLERLASNVDSLAFVMAVEDEKAKLMQREKDAVSSAQADGAIDPSLN